MSAYKTILYNRVKIVQTDILMTLLGEVIEIKALTVSDITKN